MDRAWRRKVEELRRAGIDYIAREHVILASPPESNLAIARNEDNGCAATLREMDPLALKRKTEALQVLAEEVAECSRCTILAESRTQTVFSDGTPGAELCFVGEAPGADEDREGVPFVGRAGQLLTKIIEACKLDRSEVYICNVLKCRPPENRNPTPEEICNCRPFLERQLDIIKPRMMVALGKFAAAHLLLKKPEQVPIMKMRGEIHEYRGIPFMITLHPAYLLRNPEAKRDVWEDMKTVMRELGRPID